MADTRAKAAAAGDLMTVAEFGARLKISRASAYRLIATGVVARTPVGVGGATRISEAAYEQYVADQTRPARQHARRGRKAA